MKTFKIISIWINLILLVLCCSIRDSDSSNEEAIAVLLFFTTILTVFNISTNSIHELQEYSGYNWFNKKFNNNEEE